MNFTRELRLEASKTRRQPGGLPRIAPERPLPHFTCGSPTRRIAFRGTKLEWPDKACAGRIDVSDLDHARTEAIKAVLEMRAQDPQLAKESACWALTATDETGVVLFKIPLNTALA